MTLRSLMAAALALGAPLAIAGCQTETQTEIESDGEVDRDVEFEVDEAAVDEAQGDLNRLGAEVEDGARQVGNEIEEGAAAAGAAAEDAIETIDENVDIGDNAGTPEADDNN